MIVTHRIQLTSLVLTSAKSLIIPLLLSGAILALSVV